MAKFILCDPMTTRSFDSEEEAIAYVRQRLKPGGAVEAASLSYLAMSDTAEMFVIKAEIVRKVEAILGTGPGGDHLWKDVDAEQERREAEWRKRSIQQNAAISQMQQAADADAAFVEQGAGFGNLDKRLR